MSAAYNCTQTRTNIATYLGGSFGECFPILCDALHVIPVIVLPARGIKTVLRTEWRRKRQNWCEKIQRFAVR